jgi:O-antigen/teichoic acid export membrane protein
MTVEDVAARPGTHRRRTRISGVAARLTAANVLSAATGFVTGPLLARALGASGRGDLQAVILPLSLMPFVLSLGISPFAYRTLPRGRSLDEVIPSLGLPLVGIGLLFVAAAAVPVANALAGGRGTVQTWLIVGFLTTPIVMFNLLLSSSLAALERWRGVVTMTVIPFAVPFVAIVVLYAAGWLTVATAAAATIAGSVLAFLPGLPLLSTIRRPVFRPRLTRAAFGFGVKSWLGGLAQTANARLDQLMMITLVPARQLGLYAVATTISGTYGLVTGALTPPLMARIGSGERHLMPAAVRITLMVTVALNLGLALITPVLLYVLFGPQFRGAFPMTLVLLGAAVPLAGAGVLSSALQADGAPAIPSVGEGFALAITVAGLLVLLGPLQAMGAAIVSLAAYSASFVFQLVMARRRTGAPLTNFLIPCRADARWARDLVAGALVGVRGRPRTPTVLR